MHHPKNKKQGDLDDKTLGMENSVVQFGPFCCPPAEGRRRNKWTGEKTDNEAASGEEVETKDADEIKDSSGSVPLNLKIAENPAFPVGSKVKIYADHMEGMKEAEGVVVAVYDTTAYEISYRPTTGGEEVKHYKWVIHEELDASSGAPMELEGNWSSMPTIFRA